MRVHMWSVLGGLFSVSAAANPSMGAFFQSKTVIIPKDALMETGGQDAAESSPTALVVADGVGGYSKLGIDSAPFARELTKVALEMHEIDPNVNSKNLVDFACEEAKKYEGGATAALVRLKNGMKMESAVLGDAGYMIWEVAEADKLKLKYKSPSYQKAFNMPYQCGTNQD